FDVEQRALVSLRSPYVVRIHDRGLTEHDRPYFVMELLSGRSLQDHLDQCERLEALDVLEILEDLGRAVHEPHLQGLAHRDIKPGNIFLTEYPGQRRLEVRLLDFGVAKSVVGDADEGAVTTDGMIVGTPHYVAPEQIDGTPTLRSDIYSIGIVAFRCLAGFPPFRGDQHAVLRQHLGASPPPLPPEAEVPAPLENLVRSMLEKRPEARPSASELVSAVIQVRASLFDSVPPSSSDRALALTTPKGIFTSDPGLAPKSGPSAEPITGHFEDSVVQPPRPRLQSRNVVLALIAIVGALLVAGVTVLLWPQPLETVVPLVAESPVDPAVGETSQEDDEDRPMDDEDRPMDDEDRADAGGVEAVEAPPDPGGLQPPPVDEIVKQPVVEDPPPSPPGGPKIIHDSPRTEPEPPPPPIIVRLGIRAAPDVRILKLRVDGMNYSSPPILLRRPSGSEVLIEYLGPDSIWRKKRVQVPGTKSVITLE
ncbi:MAG: protein kinase, partial [Myxococcota bacterium]